MTQLARNQRATKKTRTIQRVNEIKERVQESYSQERNSRHQGDETGKESSGDLIQRHIEMLPQFFLRQHRCSALSITISTIEHACHLATCGPTAGDNGDIVFSMFSCDLIPKSLNGCGTNEMNLTRRIVPDSSSDS